MVGAGVLNHSPLYKRITIVYARVVFKTVQPPICYAQGHMLSYAQVPRRLGAGAPLTILRFAPLVWLRLVLGLYALKCV
jgi:hypothetical protein